MFGSPEYRNNLVKLVEAYDDRIKAEASKRVLQEDLAEYQHILNDWFPFSLPLKLAESLGMGYIHRLKFKIERVESEINSAEVIEKASRSIVVLSNAIARRKRLF